MSQYEIKLNEEEKFRFNVRKTSIELMKPLEGGYLVTLTFRYNVDYFEADRLMGMFLKTNNRRVFGKKSNRELKVAIFLEHDSGGRYHYHLLFEDPSKFNDEFDMDRFSKEVKQIWESLPGATGNVNESCSDRSQWFKCIDDIEGVGYYLTKQIYRSPDVIQWQHTNIDFGHKAKQVESTNNTPHIDSMMTKKLNSRIRYVECMT